MIGSDAMAPLKHQYFLIATQYYMAGRFSVFAGLIPVCGNQFHHAIEMYLKGYLCTSLSTDQLIALGHKLDQVWEEFKKQISDPSLAIFDQTISTLDRFEKIRYPEEIVAKGMQSQIGFERPPSSASRTSPPEPSYDIYVDEIDSLVEVIFQKSKLDPLSSVRMRSRKEVAYLTESNKTTIWS